MAESMEGERVIETLNPPGNEIGKPAEGEKIEPEAGTSSIPDMSHGEDETELISTLDGGGETPEPEDKLAEEPPEGSEEEDKGKGDEAGKGEEKETPYHEIPRFKELLTERDTNLERALKAEARLEAQGTSSTKEEKDYKDITSMEDDELREWQESDPKGYAANQAKQVLDEARQVLREEFRQESHQDRVDSTHASYAEKNADYVLMLNDGRIANFMAQNPGHNAISAHKELTEQSRAEEQEANVQKLIAEAVAKREAELKADQLVKRENIPADAHGGGGVPVQSNTEGERILKDSKKAGGTAMALFKKLKLDRASRRATG